MKKDELLVPRLDFLIPMSFWGLWDTAHLDKASALGRVVEINPDWVIEVVNNAHRLEDVLHDFRGIYAEDEHFVPRIQADDVKVNGYTNIQTYRLCLILDNIQYHTKGIFTYFFDGVRDGEFEESDYEVINWNEVTKRYSNQQRSHYLGSMTRCEFTDDDEFKKYQSDAWVEAQRDAGEDA
tara:strand:+ start:1256 stop:1798 length:543 start_codon:yes stop_codon:yes gene_type:complete